MRLIKAIGLTMVAAISVMAFISAGSAFAQVKHLVVLCKENPTKLCLEGKLYKTGTVIKAELENYEGVKQAILLSEGIAGNETCTASAVEGKITHTSSLEGQITSVTFGGTCKPCSSVTISGTPFPVKVIHDEEVGKDLWLLIVTGSIKATFTGCPLGAKCVFEAKEVHLDAENTATTPLILTLKNPLKLIEGSAALCGSEGKWDANYIVTSPTPSFLALDEKEEA